MANAVQKVKLNMKENGRMGIAVVGSVNADMSIKVERFVAPGETMSGREFAIFSGGKGANQAVASGGLGGKVVMCGKTGDDILADKMVASLTAKGVDVSAVEREGGISTGTALIQVADSGENSIIIDAGANGRVDGEYVEGHKALVEGCGILMLQLEVPMEANIKAAKLASEVGATVILDPAPAVKLPTELLKNVDIITPNATELSILTGIEIKNMEDRKAACRAVCDMGVGIVINKAGGDGVYLYKEGELTHYPTFEITVVDTTGAGDSFNGALAFALSCKAELDTAINFANMFACISTTKFGAQSAMSSFDEMEGIASSMVQKERYII